MTFYPSISVITSVYQGENYLPSFLREVRNQTLFPEMEFVFILNEPTTIEKRLVKDFHLHFPDQVQILFAHQRESLAASWNRGWQVPRAPFLTMWNVDDRRIIDSLERQLKTLEADPELWLCYGDYITVNDYGKELGELRTTPSYNPIHFRRAFAQGGAFWLFRSNLSDVIGYFDEQFAVGADMELSFRMAMKGLLMGGCDGLLGYFTDTALGLSTSGGKRNSEIERTAIQLRYGAFDKVDPTLVEEANQYNLDSIKQSISWIPLKKYLPEIANYRKSKKGFWFFGKIRYTLRSMFQKTGILGLVHQLQNKFLKREI